MVHIYTAGKIDVGFMGTYAYQILFESNMPTIKNENYTVCTDGEKISLIAVKKHSKNFYK